MIYVYFLLSTITLQVKSIDLTVNLIEDCPLGLLGCHIVVGVIGRWPGNVDVQCGQPDQRNVTCMHEYRTLAGVCTRHCLGKRRLGTTCRAISGSISVKTWNFQEMFMTVLEISNVNARCPLATLHDPRGQIWHNPSKFVGSRKVSALYNTVRILLRLAKYWTLPFCNLLWPAPPQWPRGPRKLFVLHNLLFIWFRLTTNDLLFCPRWFLVTSDVNGTYPTTLSGSSYPCGPIFSPQGPIVCSPIAGQTNNHRIY